MGQPTQQQVTPLMPDSVTRTDDAPAQVRLVFLHGWGADANDLTPLGDALASTLSVPAECIQLEAPEAHPDGYGKQWYGLFPADWQAVPTAVQTLQQRLEQLSLGEIPLSKTVLIGFSQGGAMALHVGCNLPLAGVIGCSAYPHPNWQPPLVRPPVLLLHGLNDDVVPKEASEELHQLLQRGGMGCDLTTFPGGHAIPREAEDAMASSINVWLD